MLQQISEFDAISQQLEDRDVDNLLNFLVHLLVDPEQLNVKAPLAVVRLEAFAAKFAIQARYYTTVEKNNPVKKNLYYTLSDQAHNLAAAMKYMVR